MQGGVISFITSLAFHLGEQASSFLTADGQKPQGLDLERASLEELPGKVFFQVPSQGLPTPREETGLAGKGVIFRELPSK